jgi:D-alanyl-D-alanine carboxypeptidase/D-alanyl-D-alanine-endopeptidase (penicillin-binding protein 4)
MADPTLLHKDYGLWSHPGILKKYKFKFLDKSNWKQTTAGHGWMWDDFGFAFSPELSAMPIYGNLLNIKYNSDASINFTPEDHGMTIVPGSTSEPFRSHTNAVLVLPQKKIVNESYNVALYNVDGVLQNNLGVTQRTMDDNNLNWKIEYSAPLDTVLKKMMVDSDNFLAEHLLLQCGAILMKDTLSSAKAISKIKNMYFETMVTPPKWVDGSGTSHYNLVTPKFLVTLLTKMWNEFDHDRILNLQAVGGVSGTLKNNYKSKGKPYVFAKTGTISGAHALSGYVITDKGTPLAFSFLVNNHMVSNANIRTEFENILKLLYETY